MKSSILSTHNLGTICVFWGLALITVAQFQSGDLLVRIIPGSIALISGALFRGIVSIQDVINLKKKD